MASIYKINNKKILFIHIPKTAGKSIGKFFKGRKTIIDNRTDGHIGIKNIKQKMGEDFKNIYKVFTVVRNPFNWRISFFKYLKNDKNNYRSGLKFETKKIQKMTFKEHLDWLENIFKDGSLKDSLFLKNQSDYLLDKDNKIKIDYILRFENLQNDFSKMMLDLGVKANLNIHINKSREVRGEVYYSSKKEKEIVRKIWSKDFELLNYE